MPLRDDASPTPSRLPPAARRLLRAIERGSATDLLPPEIATCRVDGHRVWRPVRDLAGIRDARAMAALWSLPRFAPFLEFVQALDDWRRGVAPKYRDVVAPRCLDIVNGEFYGVAIGEALLCCAGGRDDCVAYLRLRRYALQDAIERFLRRLRRDTRNGRLRLHGYAGRVVGLSAHSEDSHNRHQRVFRLRFRGGAALAYKARPVNAEIAFLRAGDGARPASLFDALNRLPAAAGETLLPTLRAWPGSGADRDEYLWQEWIAPPRPLRTIRSAPPLRLRANRLSSGRAAQFWHRAGALSAACFAFGIADLYAGNLVVGRGPDAGSAMPYPIDLELCLQPLADLRGTALVGAAPGAEIVRDNPHVGFERRAPWSAADGPLAGFARDADGALALRRIDAAWTRRDLPHLVADGRGRVGYAAYLAAFFRGLFDQWATLCVQREWIGRELRRRMAGLRVRALRQSTDVYAEALDTRLLDGVAFDRNRFDGAELAQLAYGDVPYFYRDAGGGPLRWIDPSDGRARVWNETREARTGSPLAIPQWTARIGFVDLGVLLRDAAAYVVRDLPARRFVDRARGVEIRIDGAQRGMAAFDWPQQGHRLIYRWHGERLRLRAEPLARARTAARTADHASAKQIGSTRAIASTKARAASASKTVSSSTAASSTAASSTAASSTAASPRKQARATPSRPALRRQLLRIDRLDAALRARWAAAGFPRDAQARELQRLTRSAGDWLRAVVDEYGWPGRAFVGARAASAACRLLQHLEGDLPFRRRCLRLLRAAARAGDADWTDVAYVDDSLRVAAGKPQRYGSKLLRRDGRFVPYPIRAAARVDRRRAAVGLPPMAHYLRRAERRYAAARRAIARSSLG